MIVLLGNGRFRTKCMLDKTKLLSFACSKMYMCEYNIEVLSIRYPNILYWVSCVYIYIYLYMYISIYIYICMYDSGPLITLASEGKTKIHGGTQKSAVSG